MGHNELGHSEYAACDLGSQLYVIEYNRAQWIGAQWIRRMWPGVVVVIVVCDMVNAVGEAWWWWLWEVIVIGDA